MALKTHRWTRADLERMPDDGNRYEVIHGELLVSPAPRPSHWALVYALRRLLEQFCERHRLGSVSGENQAFVADDSETIPDLVVRKVPFPPPDRWDDVPVPLLLVEVLSPSTRRSDEMTKRPFYVESGIPEYWIVDGDARAFRVVTSADDRVEATSLTWLPTGASESLTIDIPGFFEQTIGSRHKVT